VLVSLFYNNQNLLETKILLISGLYRFCIAKIRL